MEILGRDLSPAPPNELQKEGPVRWEAFAETPLHVEASQTADGRHLCEAISPAVRLGRCER